MSNHETKRPTGTIEKILKQRNEKNIETVA